MRTVGQLLSLVLLVAGSWYIVVHQREISELVSSLTDVSVGLGAVVFVTVLTVAVVFAPVTVMPLIPVASQVFGPFMTGVLSALGWTLGGVIAFVIARYAGRPVLERFVRVERIDRFAASVPERNQFWFMVLIRHLLPVDVVSYALGLVPAIRFKTYVAATLLGVLWFSFAFAYLGDAFFTGNLYLLVEVGLASLGVLLVAWYMLRRRKGVAPVDEVRIDNGNER